MYVWKISEVYAVDDVYVYTTIQITQLITEIPVFGAYFIFRFSLWVCTTFNLHD